MWPHSLKTEVSSWTTCGCFNVTTSTGLQIIKKTHYLLTHQQHNYVLKQYMFIVISKDLPGSVNNTFFDVDIRFWKDSPHCSVLGRKSEEPISIFFHDVNGLSDRQLYPVRRILMKVVDCC
jgi:hypothetical protein